MSACNTSFNIIIEEQIAKLANVQSFINVLLESKQEIETKSKLQSKYGEIQIFVDKLMKLKDALNYQVTLCGDIKNISITLNHLVQQITCLNEEVSHETDSENNVTNVSIASSNQFYSPAEGNSMHGTEIKKLRQTSLNFSSYEIEYITQQEFTIIPKYMLGRITLDALNKFVDVVNKTLQIKYNLMSKPKSSLKGSDLQQYRDYKVQETEEVKGKYFVTENDIAKQQNKKNLEKSTYNLLVILRHTKRLTENRTAHSLKFVVQ